MNPLILREYKWKFLGKVFYKDRLGQHVLSFFVPQNLIPFVQNAESLLMEDTHSETMRSKSYSKDGEVRRGLNT